MGLGAMMGTMSTSHPQTSLKQSLRDDLTAAIKGRDQLGAGTLRMALAAVTTAEVAGKQAKELSDEEVLAVLIKEAKKRREAADAYDGAQRPELAERERAELGILERYLPQQLTADELASLVAAAVGAAASNGLEGMRAMGVVMKQLGPQVAGRADGAAVAAAVKKQLG